MVRRRKKDGKSKKKDGKEMKQGWKRQKRKMETRRKKVKRKEDGTFGENTKRARGKKERDNYMHM